MCWPPMTEDEALEFAFDTPPVSFLPHVCCMCLRPVRKKNRLAHANAEHPGWLAMWNAALREQGL